MFKLLFLYLRIDIMKELQYRVNFFIQLLQSLISLFLGLFVLFLVFSYTTTLAGWSYAELLAVMGVFMLMGGILRASIQPNMLQLMEDVQLGNLDFALTKPADSQLLVSVREFRIWQMVDVISGMVVFLWALYELQDALTVNQFSIFLLLLFCGVTMIYSFWLILTTGVFWIIRMESIVELFQGIYQAGRWPISIYPDWLRTGLTFLVPIAFAVTVPSEALTGRLTLDTLIIAIVFTVVLFLGSRRFFKFGLKNYSGASA